MKKVATSGSLIEINHFKNILEQIQIQQKGGIIARSGTLLTVMPKMKGRRRAAVPFFEGGFKLRIKNAEQNQPPSP